MPPESLSLSLAQGNVRYSVCVESLLYFITLFVYAHVLQIVAY